MSIFDNVLYCVHTYLLYPYYTALRTLCRLHEICLWFNYGPILVRNIVNNFSNCRYLNSASNLSIFEIRDRGETRVYAGQTHFHGMTSNIQLFGIILNIHTFGGRGPLPGPQGVRRDMYRTNNFGGGGPLPGP